jgi:glycosyltransferase involved in cell wall biosynthesis
MSETPEPERMRRLLSVIHGPVFGGGFNQMVQLAEPLKRRGWETIAVAPDETGNAGERLRESGLPTEVIPLHRLRASKDPRLHARLLAKLPSEIGRLRGLIRKHRIDVVQAHGDTNPHVAFAARLEGVAVVWQIYDTRTPPPLRRLTMPVVTRTADVITTWGMRLAEVHPGTTSLGERHIVVFPPVDSERFRPGEERRRAARAELGASDDEFLVAGVGNRNPTKGYEWLIRALATTRASDPSVVARVLGAPSPVHASYEAQLHEEAERAGLGESLEFRDAGTRVAELMPGLDALVISSVNRSEGIPTVIFEAMASGVPVIATRVGAIDEVLEDGRTGLLVPPEDASSLARAILELAGDRERSRGMGRAGRARVEERYGLERCADAHARAYELAVARRH